MPEQASDGKKIAGMSRKTFFVVAGIGVGGLLFILYNRSKSKGQAQGIATLPNAMPGGAQSTTSSGTSGQWNSLQDWMASVQKWANSLGFDSAITQNALQSYATGTCVSSSGFAILDQALSVFGQPPQAPFQGLVKCTNPAPAPASNVGQFLYGAGYGAFEKGIPFGEAASGAPGFIQNVGQIFTTAAGTKYSEITSGGAWQTLFTSGTDLFFESGNGVFTPYPKPNLAKYPAGHRIRLPNGNWIGAPPGYDPTTMPLLGTPVFTRVDPNA